MERTITPAEMKTLEQAFMAEYAVPSALLMEHAAQGVCAALRRRCRGGHVLFLCGPGNNGGDGYAAARLWRQSGGKTTIMELSSRASGDAAMNRTLALQCGVSILPPDDPLPECDIIVDALFGTGLSREMTGDARRLIHAARRSGKPVIAVDIPSGLDGTDGHVWGCALPAVETVTFHRIKQGLVLGQGANYAGKITVQPILIPQDYDTGAGLRIMTPGDLPALLPPRSPMSHKGTHGRAVILAGSRGMAGAAAFAANACIKAGAGLTTVLCRESTLAIVQTLAPGAVCIPLPEENCRLTAEADRLTRDALAFATAAAVGCGLGQSPDMLPLLKLFAQSDIPVVWDADALNLLAACPALLPLNGQAVITPHPGEAARLLVVPTGSITDNPVEALQKLRQTVAPHVLLKGSRTLMTDGCDTAVNLYGTPAMAKGGSGDVLTGILTALLAQKLPGDDLLSSMQLAALIHGLAGLRAEAVSGDRCVTPQELVEHIRLDVEYIPNH